MAPARRRPSRAGAQLGESLRQKQNVKKTQCRGNDKKTIMLETGTVKKELSRKLMQLSLRFQKTSG